MSQSPFNKSCGIPLWLWKASFPASHCLERFEVASKGLFLVRRLRAGARMFCWIALSFADCANGSSKLAAVITPNKQRTRKDLIKIFRKIGGFGWEVVLQERK